MTGSVASSVAGAGAGPPAPGASIYQLIGATQFMNLFGKMVDKSPVPEPVKPGNQSGAALRRKLIAGAHSQKLLS
jgi:hypothetical protein